MDKSSYFIKDRAMFGSFPTQEAVDELESQGVRYFINLTNCDETKITPYKTKYKEIKYPIIDRHVPIDWQSYAKFIIKLSDIIKTLKNGELVYIHCKGGHGRSGVVVASLLCYIFGLTPEESLEQTTKSHSKRSVMRDKWRKLGSPQTYHQKCFIKAFFSTLYFFKTTKIGQTVGFSTFSSHPVYVKDFGKFPTAEACIQAYKCPTDVEYVRNQEESKTPFYSKTIGKKVKLREDWVHVHEDIIYKVLEIKFKQHSDLKDKLLMTGLRPIIHRSTDYNIGNNKLGRALMKLRDHFYRQME